MEMMLATALKIRPSYHPARGKAGERSGFVTPAALMRSIASDGWIPIYGKAVKKVLDDQVHEVAERIADGLMQIVTPSMMAGWLFLTLEAKRKITYNMIDAGARLAQTEFPGKQGTPVDELIIGQFDDFLVRARDVNVENWLETTSRLETETSRKLYDRMFREANAYWDEEKQRGLTPREMAKQFIDQGLAHNIQRANLMARTGTIWAFNEGAELTYKEFGVTVEQWITTADDRTCEFCLSLDGQKVRTQDSFVQEGFRLEGLEGGIMDLPFAIHHPPLHPFCLTGETAILAPDKVAAFIATYCGPVVEIGFTDGRRLTVPPNHMFLTPVGFIKAGSIRKGDQILDGSRGQGIASGDPQDDGEPTPIRQVIDAFAESRGVSAISMPVSPEYLHGDAEFIDGDIHVITSDSLHRSHLQVPLTQVRGEQYLRGTEMVLPKLVGRGDLAAMLFGLGLASNGLMSPRRESLAFRSREPLHAKAVGLTGRSRYNATFKKTPPDRVPGNAEGPGKGQFGFPGSIAAAESGIIDFGTSTPRFNAVALEYAKESRFTITQRLSKACHRFPGLISMANVQFVRLRDFCGHIYDLQTASSLYLAEGLVSSNCRCTMVPVFSETLTIKG